MCIFNLIIFFILSLIFTKVNTPYMTNILMVITLPISTGLMLSFSFSKDLPGGKYFRSLPNGFEILKKVKYAITISVVLFQIIYPSIICIVNHIKPFMQYPTQSCISTAAFSLVSTGVYITSQIIKTPALQIFFTLISSLFPAAGYLAVVLSDGKIGIVQIAAVIVAVVLIPFSLKIFLNDYKKNYWIN